MKKIITINVDEKGLLHLEVEDSITLHEAIGAMHMMIKRIEVEIIKDEIEQAKNNDK